MLVEKLKEARGSHTVAFLAFNQIYKTHQKDLFCCYEGEDEKYYLSRVERYTKFSYEKIHGIVCGNKEEVLKFYELIKNYSIHSSTKIIYFIDRDFDKGISASLKKKIYETPCYSIENFYTSYDCFNKIIKTEFFLNESDGTKDCEIVRKHFLKLQKQFHKSTKLLNAWAKYQRENSGKANLNSFNLKILIKFNWDKIEKNYSISNIKRISTESIKVTKTQLLPSISFFNTEDKCQKYYRGKFEIYFFIKFISFLLEENETHKFILSKKRIRVNLQLNPNNFLSAITQYADTPDCLKIFLSKV